MARSTDAARSNARRVTALLVASGAHVAVLASLTRVPLPRPVDRIERAVPAPSELDLDEHPLEPDESPVPPRAAEPIARSRPQVTHGASTEAAEPPDDSPPVAPPQTLPETWTFSPMSSPVVDLGIGRHAEIARRFGANAETPSPSPASSANDPVARPTSSTGGVAELLSSGDIAVGMTRGGAVLQAAEEAARDDHAVGGDATFEVVMWRDGTSDVQMVNASEDGDDWSRIAAALASRVKGRKVRFPPGADGLRVTMHLEARWKLADGRDVRSLHGPRPGWTPSVLQDALSGKLNSEDHPPPPVVASSGDGDDPATPPPVGGVVGPSKGPNAGPAVGQGLAQRILPTPGISVSGKVCSGTLMVTPVGVALGGGCSFENAGTVPIHEVSGHVVREDAVKRADAGAAR